VTADHIAHHRVVQLLPVLEVDARTLYVVDHVLLHHRVVSPMHRDAFVAPIDHGVADQPALRAVVDVVEVHAVLSKSDAAAVVHARVVQLHRSVPPVPILDRGDPLVAVPSCIGRQRRVARRALVRGASDANGAAQVKHFRARDEAGRLGVRAEV